MTCAGRVGRGAGGERCEDAALALRLGNGIPAPQTARAVLRAFDERALRLWQGARSRVPGEGERLRGLAAA